MAESRAALKWLCLDSGFFDNSKIKVIRALPDGARILIVWIGLLTLAAKHGGDGMIMLSRNLPLGPETLSLLLGESVPVVTLALDTFVRLNMIEIVEASAIRITGWREHQHTEALERSRERARLRTQRFREKQRKVIDVGHKTPPAAPAPAPARAPGAGCSPELVNRWGQAFEALSATGKLPALTMEHLSIVDHDHPKARLAENVAEIAAEARGVVGTVAATLPWLRKAVRALELRVEQREATVGRVEASTVDKF